MEIIENDNNDDLEDKINKIYNNLSFKEINIVLEENMSRVIKSIDINN